MNKSPSALLGSNPVINTSDTGFNSGNGSKKEKLPPNPTPHRTNDITSLEISDEDDASFEDFDEVLSTISPPSNRKKSTDSPGNFYSDRIDTSDDDIIGQALADYQSPLKNKNKEKERKNSSEAKFSSNKKLNSKNPSALVSSSTVLYSTKNNFSRNMDGSDFNDNDNDSDNLPNKSPHNKSAERPKATESNTPVRTPSSNSGSSSGIAPGAAPKKVSGSDSTTEKLIADEDFYDDDQNAEDDYDYDYDNSYEDDQDSTIQTQLADIQEDLETLEEIVDQEAPNSPAKRKLMTLLNAASEAAKDVKKQQSIPRVQSENFSAVRQKLENTVKILLKLKEDSKSASDATKSSSSTSSTTPGSTDPVIDEATQILSTLEANEQAFLKHHLPSQENKDKLQNQIDETLKVIDRLEKNKNLFKKDLAEDLIIELASQLQQLHELRTDIENYESPNSNIKILEEKKLYVDAACAIFQSMIDDVPPNIKGYKIHIFSKAGHSKNKESQFNADAQALLNIFQSRSKILSECIATGKKPIDMPDLVSQTSKPSELIKNIQKKYKKKFNDISLDDAAFEKNWIPGVIDAFLEKYREVGSYNSNGMLYSAKIRVLNEQRDWKIIENEFLVPVSLSSGSMPWPKAADTTEEFFSATANAKVKTVTTPVGHVFNALGNLIEGGWSTIAEYSFGSYQSTDPANPGKKITTGRNSHSTTEHLHAVNAARTEIKTGDESLFSGTRHGTLSAYHLYPKMVRKMSNNRLKMLATDLISQAPLPSTNPFDDTTLTPLDEEWAKAMKKIGAVNDSDGSADVSDESIEAFLKKAFSDEKFCALMRRKVALNRAREIFLSEALGNENMLSRIQNGEPVHFNSISLITPDRMRNFLAKLFPKKFGNHDELTMRREEVQAWKDLQGEIDQGRCEIDGTIVNAKIHSFSVGVNQLSLESGSQVARSLWSGWNTVEDDNLEAITALIGDPAKVMAGTFGGQVGEAIAEQVKNFSSASGSNAAQVKAEANDKLEQIKVLASQLAAMWQSGEYRHDGDQPYKFAARIALLSSLMSSGTSFGCKSGKDRTAQLDLECKLLAFQGLQRAHEGPWLRTADGMKEHAIPPPYKGRTDFDRYQMLSFIFKDKSRTEMQRYNTGVEGSKLNYWRELYGSFIPAGEDADWIGNEFRGQSLRVKA